MSADLAQLRSLLDGFPGAALAVSDAARLLWANARAESRLGTAERLGARVETVCPGALGERIAEIVSPADGMGLSQRFAIDLDAAGGRAGAGRLAEVTIWPVCPDGGDRVWLVQIQEPVARPRAATAGRRKPGWPRRWPRRRPPASPRRPPPMR